jgi:hypothetical protein
VNIRFLSVYVNGCGECRLDLKFTLSSCGPSAVSPPSGTISSEQKKSGITKGFFRVFHFFLKGSEGHFKGSCRGLNALEKGDGCPKPENVVQRPLRGRKRGAATKPNKRHKSLIGLK